MVKMEQSNPPTPQDFFLWSRGEFTERYKMIPFIIDELTACLKDTATGDMVETEVIRLK